MSFESFFDNSSDFLILCESDGNIISANKSCKQILDFDSDDQVTNLRDFINSDEISYWNEWFDDENPSKDLRRSQWKHREGKLLWMESSYTSFDGKVLIASRDITDTVLREQALLKIQEVANIGFWSVNLENQIPWWSSGTYKIHGIDESKQFDLAGAIDFYIDGHKEKLHRILSLAPHRESSMTTYIGLKTQVEKRNG